MLLMAFLFITMFCYSQNKGIIEGKISTVSAEPISSATVFLVEFNKLTLTDENGAYSFKDVNPGSYTLKIQVLGAPVQELAVKVNPGAIATADYRFESEIITVLQEVRVTSASERNASKTESAYVARMPLKDIENPQVYHSVSKELVRQQMTVDLGSVSKNVPGAGIPTIANQGRVTFMSRGFSTEPNARNGVAGAAFAAIDLANLERLEVIKGPSTTLFGTNIASSYGGLYNRVTKKPFNGTGGEVAYYGGRWDFNRLTWDYNTAVNDDKTALFRINGATSFEKSFQDLGFTNSVNLAPSFSYQVTDKLSVLLDAEIGFAKGTSVVRFNPYNGSGKTQSIADMQFPYKKNFLSNDLPYTTQMFNIFAQLNYQISDTWRSQTIISRARSTINGYITALIGRSDSTIRPRIIVGNTSFIATDIQQNFIGDFNIGNHRNRVVVGLDYYNNSNSFDRVTVNTTTMNFINPDPNYSISRFEVDSLTVSGSLRKENSGDDTYAAYISDVFNVTDQLVIMGSLRLDRYEYSGVYDIPSGTTAGGIGTSGSQAGPYGQTAISHKSGLVYQVIKDRASVFANYMNGFFNKSGVSADGKQFEPEHANQLEFGVKGNLFDHRLIGTISYYDISVANILRTDPNDANYDIQDGTQESKGMEVDITANPINGLTIVAGYAYNDSKYTQSDESVEGLRPAQSGPANMYNFWVSYQFYQGNLKGVGLGIGGNGGSKAYQTNTKTAKVIIPAYHLFDASVYYERAKFRLGLKVDNFTSEKTWSVRLTPQAPARFIGSLALKF